MNDKPDRPILTVLCLVLPQLVLAICVFVVGNDPHDYMLAIGDKYTLAESTSSPKIILAGGSSVAWGSDSGVFAADCRMPCVNLAINAGQGINFRLNEALNFASAGDVIVLTIEYYELTMKPSGYVAAKTFAASLASLPFAGLNEIRATLDEGLLELLARRTRSAVRYLACGTVNSRVVYDKRNFNESGDFVGHYETPQPNRHSWGLKIAHDPEPALDQVRLFIKRCNESGVQVFYRLPCVPQSLAAEKIEQLNEIETALREIFGSNLLNQVDETFLPDDAFFDTSYHLIGGEAHRQSQILAARLAEKLTKQ